MKLQAVRRSRDKAQNPKSEACLARPAGMGAGGKQSLAPRAEEATLSRSALGKIGNLRSEGLIITRNVRCKKIINSTSRGRDE